MPPKSAAAVPPARSSGNSGSTRDYATYIYRELTAAENQSVIRSVAIFGVSGLLPLMGRGALALGVVEGDHVGQNKKMEESERGQMLSV